MAKLSIRIELWFFSGLFACLLSACDDASDTGSTQQETVSNLSLSTIDSGSPPAGNVGDALPSAIPGASQIPYPIYPNGNQYRVGGENGLKIVVFQTTDSFDDVDQYYQAQAVEQGMERLSAMTDYVRYSNTTEDKDPWATYRPGIVIHQFTSDEERQAVGAQAAANTNIIMSF